MNLSIDTHRVDDGAVRLVVAGEVDFATCEHLRTAIHDSLTEAHITELIVDLNGVSFLDSSGIRALMEGSKLATERRVGYLVTNPRRIVHRVLELTGVLPILTHP
jgi:anti-sigma B factor antagonist